MLDNENNDIYIDKKVKNFDQNYLKIIVKKSNIYFIKRMKVSWGGDTQIKCELRLIKEASKKKI